MAGFLSFRASSSSFASGLVGGSIKPDAKDIDEHRPTQGPDGMKTIIKNHFVKMRRPSSARQFAETLEIMPRVRDRGLQV